MKASLPVALRLASRAQRSRIIAQRRIGKYTAGAEQDGVFEAFEALVLESALEVLANPVRMLTLRHVINAIAQRITGLTAPSRVLIEGFVLELVLKGNLRRLTTLSMKQEPYYVLIGDLNHFRVRSALIDMQAELINRGTMSLSRAVDLLPGEFAESEQNARILLGHLLYLGVATTDAVPGSRVELIRLSACQS